MRVASLAALAYLVWLPRQARAAEATLRTVRGRAMHTLQLVPSSPSASASAARRAHASMKLADIARLFRDSRFVAEALGGIGTIMPKRDLCNSYSTTCAPLGPPTTVLASHFRRARLSPRSRLILSSSLICTTALLRHLIRVTPRVRWRILQIGHHGGGVGRRHVGR